MNQAIKIKEPAFFILQDGTTHFEGNSVFITITDIKGVEVFRKIFDTPELCQTFVDKYCISFKGLALLNYQHPLVEIFEENKMALAACDTGHLIVNAYKETVTILEPTNNTPEYSEEWMNFKARITVEKIVTHVLTRYNQFFTELPPIISSNPTRVYEGVIGKSTRFFIGSL